MNTTINTSIKDIRKETGMNRREFSEELGIPYMTLTDWELGKHEPPPYVERLLNYYIRLRGTDIVRLFDNANECHKWDEQASFRTDFPIIINHGFVPVKNIYPLKQKTAVSIHEALKQDGRVMNIILFGSSVTMRCRQDSDTDLAVRLMPDYFDNDTKNEISEIIQDTCGYNADIIWHDRLSKDERIYQNILKGVQIL